MCMVCEYAVGSLVHIYETVGKEVRDIFTLLSFPASLQVEST